MTKPTKHAGSTTAARVRKGTATPAPDPDSPRLFPAVGSLPRDAEARLVRSLAAEIGRSWHIACGHLVSIGQLVIDACHEGDHEAALDKHADSNGRFAALSRKVDALGIGLSPERLSVARRIVAWNHHIRSPYWDQLDDGHKEVLLRAKTQETMIAGARWAMRSSATTRRLKAWLQKRRAEAEGEDAVVERGIRWKSAASGLATILNAVSPKSLERIGADVGAMTAGERKEALRRLESVREALPMLEALLKR